MRSSALAGFPSELRQSARQLAHAPSFTLPTIAGLALGIAAAVTVFSAVHAAFFRSMGFTDPASIVSIWDLDAPRGEKHVEVSLAEFDRWRIEGNLFQDVALVSSVNLDYVLLGDGPTEQVDGTTVTGGFFHLLGAKPALGRFFGPDDDRPGAPVRAVISHRLWISRFGGDANIVGRQIRAGGDPVTIVAVASPEFDFPRDVDIWVPLRAVWPNVAKSAQVRVFRAVGRLSPGVRVEQARARMETIAREMQQTLPAGEPRLGAWIAPIVDDIFGNTRSAVAILFGAVVLVLLIACANAANLLLARVNSRSHELAVRASLGSSRARLVRLLLAEALLLGIASGAIGIMLSSFGVGILSHLAPADIPHLDKLEISLPVLLFALGAVVVTVLLSGLAPAWLVARRNPGEWLGSSERTGSADRAHVRFRRLLIIAETALAVLLLVDTGLLVRSFWARAWLEPGFVSGHVLTFRVTTALGTQPERRALYTGILEKLRALPGVKSAGAVLLRPLSGDIGWDNSYRIEGQSPEESRTNPQVNYEAISPSYFATMGIRLIAGRDFTPADAETAPAAAIVSESMAKRNWPGDTAIGRHIRLGENPKQPWLTVVGVAHDVRYREWDSIRPDVYVPYFQRAQHRSDFVVKTAGDPLALVAAIRREVLSRDANQPISNVTTMAGLVDRALARSRYSGVVFAVLAACALVLGGIGLHGALSYSVTQRVREIGIRMALGATPGHMVRGIMREGLLLAGAGAVIGLAAAKVSSALLSSLLFGITASDPAVYAVATGTLLLSALIATLSPAARAAMLDPIRALRR
jgi:putative ABC transport system permease protein